jgi:hypothetical protein
VAKNEGSRKEQEQGQELGSNRWVTMEFDSNVGWHLCVVVRIFVFLTKSLFFWSAHGIRHNLATGITTFKSRTFYDWQKSGGKNLFPGKF